jgi:hypothetical protein
MGQATRGREPVRRRVQVMLDGDSAVVRLTRNEEQRLRQHLQPFLAHARVVLAQGEQAKSASAALRAARLASVRGRVDAPCVPVPGTETLETLVAAASELMERGLSDATRRTYRRRWATFERWCESVGQCPLPAAPETVSLFLAHLLDLNPPPSLSTVRGHVYAVGRCTWSPATRRPRTTRRSRPSSGA